MLEIWRKYVWNAGLDLMYRDEREFYDFTREQLAAGGWGEGSRGGSAQQPCTSHIIINLWNLHRMTGQQFKGRQAKQNKYVGFIICLTVEFLDSGHTGSVCTC